MRRLLASYGKRQFELPVMEYMVNAALIKSCQRTLVGCDASMLVLAVRILIRMAILALLSGPGMKRSVVDALDKRAPQGCPKAFFTYATGQRCRLYLCLQAGLLMTDRCQHRCNIRPQSRVSGQTVLVIENLIYRILKKKKE